MKYSLREDGSELEVVLHTGERAHSIGRVSHSDGYIEAVYLTPGGIPRDFSDPSDIDALSVVIARELILGNGEEHSVYTIIDFLPDYDRMCELAEDRGVIFFDIQRGAQLKDVRGLIEACLEQENLSIRFGALPPEFHRTSVRIANPANKTRMTKPLPQ